MLAELKFTMLKKTENHIAIVQLQPIRLQEYGVGIFPTLPTKSAIKKALKKQLIFVNGQLATTATLIHGNETITFHHSEKTNLSKRLILKLEVVYEDDHLAIINKPAGILVSGNTFKTVDNALSQNLRLSTQPDATQPRPVHRLDYATTGLLLIGKTSSSILALNKLFQNKQVNKEYFAVTIGKMETKGILNFPVDEKEAVSNFEVIEKVSSERFEYLNLVRLFPKTGRRHQLRKHLLELGNPILGDASYNKEGLILKGKGLYLHAFALKFNHPITHKEVHINKDLPSKFKKLFKSIN